MKTKTFTSSVNDFKVELPYDFYKAKKIIIKFNDKEVVYEGGNINFREPIMYMIHEKYIYFRSKELDGTNINNMDVEIEYAPFPKSILLGFKKGQVVLVTNNDNYKAYYAEETPFKAEIFAIDDYPCFWVRSLATGKDYELYDYQIEKINK